MSRRRRKQQSSSDFFPVILIVLLGLGAAISQSQTTVILLLLIILTFIALVTFVVYVLNKNKRELLSQSGIEEIDQMSGLEFEKYLQALLERRGYRKVILTTTYDLGVDLVAEKDGETWAIQAKRYKSAVGLDAVRQVVAAANHYKSSRTMVITNSYFTNNAQTIADSTGCVLVDRSALIKLILQNNTEPQRG